jgi:hypothetical protein
MNDQELKHIYIEILNGRGNRGSFLRAFAEAYCWADEENLIILRSAAYTIAAKYNLLDYLDNYEVSQ